MKKLIILSLLMLFFVTNSFSFNSYHKSAYVNSKHLHQIFNKVKRNSDVSQKALSEAFNYYEKYRFSKRLSSKYLAIADYTKEALEKRLYVVNLHSGNVKTYLVAHGKNSGEKYGRVWQSSNEVNSLMTPFGFFKVGYKEGITVQKKHDYLSVKGLEWRNRHVGKSSKDGGRDVLVHTASYVKNGGRSFGCFAIRNRDKIEVFSQLKRALLYSYTGR